MISISGVHRGFLLSLSADQKHQMCLDCFYAQLYKEVNPPGAKGKRKAVPSSTEDQTRPQFVITDDVLTDGVPQHSLIVVNMEAKEDEPETGTEDLMFRCLGINFPYRAPDYESNLYLSYAFRSAWMYSLFPNYESEEIPASIIWYIGMSPEYVQMNQSTLENGYINTRRNLSKLDFASSSRMTGIKLLFNN